MTANRMKWICCQLGAREHYAIPRALFRLGMLDWLVTDAWVPPASILRIVARTESEIRDRWHEELKASECYVVQLVAYRYLRSSRARVASVAGQK